jgi:hypothetical protein
VHRKKKDEILKPQIIKCALTMKQILRRCNGDVLATNGLQRNSWRYHVRVRVWSCGCTLERARVPLPRGAVDAAAAFSASVEFPKCVNGRNDLCCGAQTRSPIASTLSRPNAEMAFTSAAHPRKHERTEISRPSHRTCDTYRELYATGTYDLKLHWTLTYERNAVTYSGGYVEARQEAEYVFAAQC